MARVFLVALLCVALPAQVDDSHSRLGTLRVHAWLGKPSMPPIALTRGPLQQIIETIQPERARPAAHAWEDAITRDRRLVRAAQEAIEELQRHYAHQLVVRPSEAASIERRLAAETARLRARFEVEADLRSSRLRLRENVIMSQLRRAGANRSGAGQAASQLLIAEIQFARHQHTHRKLMLIWERKHRAFLKGERDDDPAEQMPYLKPTIGALVRVGQLAPDRLTRERAAQLLSMVHHANGDLDAAVKTLQGVLKRHVSWALRAELFNRLGDLLLLQGRFAGAARQYGTLREKDGSWYVRARLGLAWSRHRLGDDDGALKAVQEVRKRLAGLFDGSAVALLAEADLLYAQLLADGTRPLPATLGPRLMDVVLALRKRQATMVRRGPDGVPPTAATSPPKLDALTQRIRPMRACYRRFLRSTAGTSVRGVVALRPGTRTSLVSLSTPDRRLRACIDDALRAVPSAGLPAGMLSLELEPEAASN